MQKKLLPATKNRTIALENVAIKLLNAKNVAKRRRKRRELLHILYLQV